MPIRVAVPKEIYPGERRVALVPEVSQKMAKLDIEVLVETGAGNAAHYPDAAFASARIVNDAASLYGEADIVLTVQPPTPELVEQLREGSILIGMLLPYQRLQHVTRLRERNITSFAMELVPRISRAQSMDALSSQAAAAGYKAVIMAAERSGRFFPMLTTAAGTIRPSKVVVIGAGVAGLQAIATARRLGAMVEGYDVRAATKEQVESLGARFIDIKVAAEGTGGYARELTEDEKQQQQATLAEHIAAANVVICTAALPGRPSPMIITTAMVDSMKPGAVIIDLAAEGGGNCELTRAGEEVLHNGISIVGPLNVPSMLAVHASEMYAKNLFNFLSPMIRDGTVLPDWEDPVFAESVLTHQGEIRHAPTRAQVEGESS
ncbi:MAG: Re/Si-specific NAD(P)(+) transhydrogenase subunit alpha [Gammaproteobacteria bacterium]|jgi:NAD(P) transhydrogenase subunit alpha|nr:Re/Si-specific NAD(P)(+) transhydrogenase subunit alpha [Gammaproteobacteria bacterium]